MNSKFLFVIFLCISLVAQAVSTQVCFISRDAFNLADNFVNDRAMRAATTSCQYGVQQQTRLEQIINNATLSTNIQTLTDPNVGLVNTAGTGFGIYDFGFAVISLAISLTGLPVYLLFFSFGLPMFVPSIIATTLFLIYLLGVIEFLRGGSL